jgi:hypothetical protein
VRDKHRGLHEMHYFFPPTSLPPPPCLPARTTDPSRSTPTHGDPRRRSPPPPPPPPPRRPLHRRRLSSPRFLPPRRRAPRLPEGDDRLTSRPAPSLCSFPPRLIQSLVRLPPRRRPRIWQRREERPQIWPPAHVLTDTCGRLAGCTCGLGF